MKGQLMPVSQSSCILLPQLRHRAYARPFRNSKSEELGYLSPLICAQPRQQQQQQKLLLKWTATRTRAVSDSKAPILTGVQVEIEIEPDTSSGGGDDSLGGGDGGEGGEGGGGGGDNNEAEGGSGESDNIKKMAGMSMSQKLTLGYAALVGVGGVMGYLKSGSKMSLASGGLSALLLSYVYTELPTRPAFASSLGFGLSAALLVLMGSRFKKSGKIFPAGVVSFVSLVMTGGYLHGILRSLH